MARDTREGEAIPITGRIAAVADVFDSLAHARLYKKAFPPEEALGLIREGTGSQFDLRIVEAFMVLVERGVVARLDEIVKEDVAEFGENPGRAEVDLLAHRFEE